MEGDTVQPTPISKEEYIKFKQFVQDTHGKTRGHLSTEIENALREYRQPDNQQDKLSRIENDVAHVKSLLADAEADGGSVAQTPDSDDSRTHAENSKPRPNAPRSKKVEYIISQYYNLEGGKTRRSVVEKQVADEFNFEQRTTKGYVDDILKELEAKKHPDKNGLFVWGDSLEAAIGEVEDSARNEASDKLWVV